MLLSKYTSFGNWSFAGEDPIGKVIEDDKLINIGFEDNFVNDPYLKGKLYADAMTTASVRDVADRLRFELHPLHAQTFLPLHEAQLGIIPYAGQTKQARRQLVWTVMRLNLDGTLSAIHAALQDLLGSKLSFYRTTYLSELRYTDRVRPGSDFEQSYDVPIRLVKLDVPVAKLYTPIQVPVTYVAGDTSPFQLNSYLFAEPGNHSRHEKFQILNQDDTSITAQFTIPHDAGTFIRSGHWPCWPTLKRMHHICLTGSNATDKNLRAQIDFLMHRMVKGTATWQVLEESAAATSEAMDPWVSNPWVRPMAQDVMG